MSLKKETVIVWFAYLVIIAVVVAGVWYVPKIKRKIYGKDEIKQAINEMIAKHNASTQWSECFDDYGIKINGGYRPIFLADVETALVSSDSRPIFFWGGVNDVRKSDAEYSVVFRTLRDIDITFLLSCNAKQAEIISGQPEGFYGIIASISDVHVSDSKVNDNRSDNVSFINRFIVKGVCLDFSFAGRDYNPWDD